MRVSVRPLPTLRARRLHHVMAFSDPKNVIAQCGLPETGTVVEFGAGSGHYSLAAAQILTSGRVIAIDIQKDLAARIKREAHALHLQNVEILWGDVETPGGSKLSDGAADVVIIANTLFQMHHRSAAITEAFRILKPGGKVIFIDWSDSFGGLGPRTSEVVTPAVARELFERQGFKMERELTGVGDHHYGFIVRKT